VVIIIARVVLTAKPPAAKAAPHVIAVAAKAMTFGDKITPDKIKMVAVPPVGVPAGAYTAPEQVVGDGHRVAIKGIAENEVITPNAISGTGARLSNMGAIEPGLRAYSISISEHTGVSGLPAPGDHVDVFITRTPADHATAIRVTPPGVAPRDGVQPRAPAQVTATSMGGGSARPQPQTDLLLQDVRVLAMGQTVNPASDKPVAAHVVTLEVSPAQAGKLALAAQAGTLSLALRSVEDNDPVHLSTIQTSDLHEAVIARPAARRSTGRRAPPAGPAVVVVRSGEATQYRVPM
jgi:pilus assembly protein CpaB